MSRSSQQLRQDAEAIWLAGLRAVDSERLVQESMRVEGRQLALGDLLVDLDEIDRIAVVGAGKAGAGMAAAVEQVLGSSLLDEKNVVGWVNVPADCVRTLDRIKIHAARPAGVNEPTAEGVEGAQQIEQIAAALGPRDLCLCLISGGGSALLPAPAPGVTLADKAQVTKFLSAAGANIDQLNVVRRQLSRLKGGGLAAACRAGRLVSLIISDVIGDPLDVIASGPTVYQPSQAAAALAVLEEFDAREGGVSQAVFDAIARAKSKPRPRSEVTNLIIGNNAVAVDAAGMEAERRGYSHAMVAARELEGPAERVGEHLASMALSMRGTAGPNCLITGGEPVVELVNASRRGLGGRNQQLAIAALSRLIAGGGDCRGIALLSGGTDGEDGPTDAAGAVVDATVAESASRLQLDPAYFAQRNDAYHFFEQTDGLIKTGPTHTNVCDVRVVVVDQDVEG